MSFNNCQASKLKCDQTICLVQAYYSVKVLGLLQIYFKVFPVSFLKNSVSVARAYYYFYIFHQLLDHFLKQSTSTQSLIHLLDISHKSQCLHILVLSNNQYCTIHVHMLNIRPTLIYLQVYTFSFQVNTVQLTILGYSFLHCEPISDFAIFGSTTLIICSNNPTPLDQ